MALVTDSFCERCGTRYVFQAPPSKSLSMKNARTLAKGLRNFVMNDGQSMEDSLHAARNENESADSSRLTQAFHRAFNFCMSCRQYACERCWNAKAGACLTCAPLTSSIPVPEHEHLIVRTPITRVDDERDPVPTQASYAGPGAFGGPASSAGTASFSAGRLTTAPQAPVAQPVQPAWPETDLRATETPNARDDGSIFDFGGESKPAPRAPEWRLRRGSVDGESVAEQIADHWSAWPMADPLAPEATLTPEELSLVEAHLSRGDDETAPAEAIDVAAAPEVVYAPIVEAQVSPAASAFQAVKPAPEPSAPAPSVPSVLSMPEPVARPAAARAAAPAPAAQPLPLAFMALRGKPSNGIWPNPTPWAERPVKTYGFVFADEAAVEAQADVEAFAPAEPFVAQVAAEGVADFVAAPFEQPAEEPPFVFAPAPEPIAFVQPAAFAPAPAAPIVEPEPQREPAQPQPIVLREIPVGVAWQQRISAAQSAPVEPVAPAPVASPAPAPQPAFQAPLAPAQQPPVPQPVVPPVPAYVEQPNPAWPPIGAQWPGPPAQSPVWPAPQGVAAPAAVISAKAVATTEMWAQSAEEVMNRGTVRVCHHCSLPLSTHARFCRRCGTSQN